VAAAARPGLVQRLKDGWKQAWAPSWAGVPNWVHHLWESSGRASGKFHAWARQSAPGRVAINALGTVMAGIWAVVDKLAGLRGMKVPAFAPAGPLERPLPTFPGPATWLGTRGNQIVDPAGKPIRLRGVNLSGLEYDKAADPLSPARLDQLKAMGANVIRVPLNQDWALADPAYVKRLDAQVERAAARGMYVLFDMHWIDGHQAAAPTAETATMWRQLANRYSQQPSVLYDLQNEPGMIGWEANAQWAEALIKEIRQVHPRSLVMVEGTNKGQRIAGALDRPVAAANVVYQVHAYGPRQHGPGVGPAQWDRLFGKTAEKLPVFVGEFGGLDDELGALSDLIKYLDTKGIGWAAWHLGAGDVFAADGSLAPLGKVVAEGLKR